MSKGSLYAAFVNALFGVLLSLLLKGNVLIYSLTFVIFLTILFIERRWIYEKVFRQKTWRAVAGSTVLAGAMVGFFILVTGSNRDTSLIVKTAHSYFNHLRAGEYAQAYDKLSTISKKAYAKDSFVKDHQRSSIKIQDFRIDEVQFNEFDKRKAVVRISSPFSIYGQNSLSFELVKEEEWRLVFSPTLIAQNTPKPAAAGSPSPRREKKRSSGSPETVGRVLRSLF